MGYTIQAGAFAQVEHAVRLTVKLKGQGLDATYFKASDGLFKVRFGNFSSKDSARLRGQSLQRAGMIEEFYVVLPEDSAAVKREQYGTDYLREVAGEECPGLYRRALSVGRNVRRDGI